MNELIIWNNSLFRNNIEDPTTTATVVGSRKELLEIINEWKKFSSIIVLCELNWSYEDKYRKMQHFSGIDLVKELRRSYDIDLPVLFVSFYPIHLLYNATNEILTSVGHSFHQLPGTPESFKNLIKDEQKISSLELKDIQLFSCSLRGIVTVKIHQVRGIVNRVGNYTNEALQIELEKCIEDIHRVFKEDPFEAISKLRERFPLINEVNVNNVLEFINDIGNELIIKYSQSEFSAASDFTEKKNWKLLLLDDEINDKSALVKLLNAKGVSVVCTSTADDAMKALSEDNCLRGAISLIISDYRLIDNTGNVPVQQKKQGYAFLHEVAENFRGRLISAVVYSGMPRQFLLETFKTFKIRTEIYSKIDFKPDDAGARNFLVERLIEIGDENYNALQALPLSSRGWAAHLHDTYLMYRRQPDYEKKEKDISDFCTQWVDEFRTGQNPVSPMSKGDIFKPRKGDLVSTLEKFEAYYKTRRIAQFLNIYYESRKAGDPLDLIPAILSPENKKMDTPELKRGFFSQIIGLKREEFPFGATIEELNWFEYDLGIKVLNSYKRYRQKLNKCEHIIGEFIQEIGILKANLEKNDFKYIDERKHELLFDQKSFKPYLFDKTDIGLCMQWFDKNIDDLNRSTLEAYLNEFIVPIKDIWK